MAGLDTPVENTPYSDEELEYFKDLLLEKRKESMEELEKLQESIDRLIDTEEDDKSSMSHHQGDVSNEYEEEETTYTLIERNKKYIEQIEAALERIKNKTYGVCQATGEKIEKRRLEAVPHTRYSIRAKKEGLAKDNR